MERNLFLKGNAIEAVSAISIDVIVMRKVVKLWNLRLMWTADHCEASVK